MYGPGGQETFWLDFTNIGLGLFTLLCTLAVVAGMAREIVYRLRTRRALRDDHAFSSHGLGVTMADGGERIEEVEAPEPKVR